MVYADVDGNIGWVAAALTPVRKGWDGLLPVPGAKGAYEWQGFLPLARNCRRSINPADHYVATANHNILPPGLQGTRSATSGAALPLRPHQAAAGGEEEVHAGGLPEHPARRHDAAGPDAGPAGQGCGHAGPGASALRRAAGRVGRRAVRRLARRGAVRRLAAGVARRLLSRPRPGSACWTSPPRAAACR